VIEKSVPNGAVYRKAEAKNPDGKGGYDGGISPI
jgi:hypothetical protein